MMEQSPMLKCERDGAVAVLTLNRPESRNALTRELLRQLTALVAQLDADDSIGAIILTGADPAFCAGVDLNELMTVPGAGREFGPRSEPIFEVRTPLIGAVNGPAYTGGFELALNCHWLLASERARFADTHAKFGFLPGWGLSLLLSEAIGRRRARYLSVTGQSLDAKRAYEWGLVNEIVDHQSLLPRAREIAEQITRQPRPAVRALTELFNQQARATDTELWNLESDSWIDPDSLPSHRTL
ncbi:enoyl-CoA hydratase [Leucobacter sp. Z1108]|uniref:enoyl-CoA hydratase n=1 Tax=Leucobacter sp. Z1108 TaxID=3439066 RepID=UPI003F2D0CB3